MTNWLTRLVWETNGRPFTPDELDRLTGYAESLPDRLAAAKQLEDSQKWLTRQLVDLVTPLAVEWGLPKEPFSADLAQALSAVTNAMLLDDPASLRTGVLATFAGLADALDVPRDEFGKLFAGVWAVLTRRLDLKAQGLLGPYFQAVVDGLCVAEAEPVAVAV